METVRDQDITSRRNQVAILDLLPSEAMLTHVVQSKVGEGANYLGVTVTNARIDKVDIEIPHQNGS